MARADARRRDRGRARASSGAPRAPSGRALEETVMNGDRRSSRLDERADRRLELVGRETEGAAAAVVGDAAVDVDEVEPIGPGRVGGVHRVVDVVNERRELLEL